MSFAVTLLTDSAQVEPGTSVPVTVEVLNHGEAEDHFELSVEGLDPEWTAVPVPTFALEPGKGRSERFFLKPPRDSDSTAGSYPFVVRVRSLDTGESKPMQGVLVIKSFTHLALDVSPRKSQVTPFRRETVLSVSASNLGNTEQALQLFASDTDDAFAYEFETNQVSLAPGSTRELTLKATAATRALFAPTRLHQVSVTGRNVANPAIAASASAQIEQRALMTPLSFIAGLLCFLMLVAWVVLLPKPPSIVYLRVDPDKVVVGQPVTIKWSAKDATGVYLTVGSASYETDPTKEMVYTPSAPGPVIVTIHAISGERKSQDMTKTLMVEERKEAPMPEIVLFEIKPGKVRMGDTFLVAYKLGPSVTEARLMPVDRPLELNGDSIQLKADMVGTVVYKLIAKNADGKTVDKSVTVNVVQESKAQISKFVVAPLEVDPLTNRVTVEWACSQATKVQLLVGDQTIDLDVNGGKQDVTVLKDSTITLTATDSDGLVVQKKIEVKMKHTDSTPPVGSTTGTTTGTTVGGGG
ncbi:MAG: hypothetical protein JSS65_01070 [Armatimonadetes bacterium]|nr:hypothetical protein [Armatimonadota bacterium]